MGVLANVYCTQVFLCFFLSCKANARVKLAKMGHGPHSTTLVVICVVRLLFVLFFCYLCHSFVICVVRLLFVSFVCYLCCSFVICVVLFIVYVYCHRVTTKLQLINITSYHKQ